MAERGRHPTRFVCKDGLKSVQVSVGKARIRLKNSSNRQTSEKSQSPTSETAEKLK
jgi:hypothetical protein